ncbi:fungal-specific transcription factor domain-containing protein [Aspergillus floccosus]
MEANMAASRLVPIAPAPARTSSVQAQHESNLDMSKMGFNCQACVRKKIRCDKITPTCSSCSKAKLQCIYQAPRPRKRRRNPSEGVQERVGRYERILRNHNLLPTTSTSTPCDSASKAPNPTVPDSQPARSGKLRSADGKSRYMVNVLLDMGEGELCEVSDPDGEEDPNDDTSAETPSAALHGVLAAQTITGALLGRIQSLTEQHPSHEEAKKLWNAYVHNVEPLCKVLHVPTVGQTVDAISKEPSAASKNDECLLFAIYYFAVFSMSDADCLQEFRTPRSLLMSKYRAAVHQALVNASWLKTTAMGVLQAYTLFLIAMRTQTDPDTFWVLTGISIRLAQRMGLHRDGERLGLPPFEVQMRRRLFWQLLPLDSYAGQVSGTGISIPPNSWDTEQPLNIDDNQIYPGMTEPPRPQRGATEMIYCLSRIELSNFYTRTGIEWKELGATVQFRDAEDIERLIDDVEDRIETNFLRYCDIQNPVHFLTSGIVRSATNAVRLRARIPLLTKQCTTDKQRRDICALAAKILDSNNAIYRNSSVKGFRWRMQAFFLWDALLCILRFLADVGFYSPSELDNTWYKVAEIYSNHDEISKGKRGLHAAIWKATLKAWHANPPDRSSPEPDFVSALRAQCEQPANRQWSSISGGDRATTVVGDAFDFGEWLGDMDGTDLRFDDVLDHSDWAF